MAYILIWLIMNKYSFINNLGNYCIDNIYTNELSKKLLTNKNDLSIFIANTFLWEWNISSTLLISFFKKNYINEYSLIIPLYDKKINKDYISYDEEKEKSINIGMFTDEYFEKKDYFLFRRLLEDYNINKDLNISVSKISENEFIWYTSDSNFYWYYPIEYIERWRYYNIKKIQNKVEDNEQEEYFINTKSPYNYVDLNSIYEKYKKELLNYNIIELYISNKEKYWTWRFEYIYGITNEKEYININQLDNKELYNNIINDINNELKEYKLINPLSIFEYIR